MVHETYNYREELKADLRRFIRNSVFVINKESRVEVQDRISDLAFENDNVTGGESGSYTMCKATAKKYVFDNIELAIAACKTFEYTDAEIGTRFVNEDWEWFDVRIRMYLFNDALTEVFDELCN